MPLYQLARFTVRREAREEAERAMHELASKVRAEIATAMMTVYREGEHYIVLVRDNRAASESLIVTTLQPFVDEPVTFSGLELVTSSDLAPRHRDRKRR